MMLFHSRIPFQIYLNRGRTVYTPILRLRDKYIPNLLLGCQYRQRLGQQALRNKLQARSSFHIDPSQHIRALLHHPAKGLLGVILRHTNHSGRYPCKCLENRIRCSVVLKTHLLYPCKIRRRFLARPFLLALFQLQCRVSSHQGLHWIEDCLVSLYRAPHIRHKLLPETVRPLFRRLFPGQSSLLKYQGYHLCASCLQRPGLQDTGLLLPSSLALFRPTRKHQYGVLRAPLSPYLQRLPQAGASHPSQQAAHQL